MILWSRIIASPSLMVFRCHPWIRRIPQCLPRVVPVESLSCPWRGRICWKWILTGLLCRPRAKNRPINLSGHRPHRLTCGHGISIIYDPQNPEIFWLYRMHHHHDSRMGNKIKKPIKPIKPIKLIKPIKNIGTRSLSGFWSDMSILENYFYDPEIIGWALKHGWTILVRVHIRIPERLTRTHVVRESG